MCELRCLSRKYELSVFCWQIACEIISEDLIYGRFRHYMDSKTELFFFFVSFFKDNILLKLQTAQQAVGVVIIKTCVTAQLSWVEDKSVRCLHQVQRSCEWQGHLKRQAVPTDCSCVTSLQLHVAVHPMQPLKLLYILRRCHAQAKGK